ncbi:MAG: hypothetical protein SCH98_08390 [Deferrisomatales bacterium]|nr:hypothetical protein [Deferrisomatales bacterium]
MARRYQERVVLPHCGQCRRPCCGLDTLALELTWARLRGVWGLKAPRASFDRALARGEGPEEIRPQDGLYYAHGRVCPAYRGRRCAVYGTPLKPPGCSEFPVYEDDGGLLVDLRCEAVDPGSLEGDLARALGPGYAVTRTEDPAFSFLVTLRAVRRDG